MEIDYENVKQICLKVNELKTELQKYKDIEEELGIDLITIWKAKTNTFFFKDKFGKVWPVMFQSIDHITKIIHFTILDEQDIRNSCAFLKDYGINWALTKEELK